MEFNLVAGILLSGGIGLSLGLMGSGGAIITMPILVYVMGVDVHEAVVMSLAVVGVTSLTGVAFHYHLGTVHLKTGFLFALFGIMGAYGGSYLTHFFSAAALLLTLAALMLIIAVLMLTRVHVHGKIDTRHGEKILQSAIAGFGVGALTGFLGVGGGFLIVPALMLFLSLPVKQAMGTSLLVISLNSSAGLLGHLLQNSFNYHLASLVTIGAGTGMIVGIKLAGKASTGLLQKGFAAFLIAMAVFLILKNYRALY